MRTSRARSHIVSLVMVGTFLGGFSLAGCGGSGTSADTAMAGDSTPADVSSSSVADQETESGDTNSADAPSFCAGTDKITSLDMDNLTSDAAGEAVMAIDQVYGNLPTSLHAGTGPLLDFLMQFATMGTEGSNVPTEHKTALTELNAWISQNC